MSLLHKLGDEGQWIAYLEKKKREHHIHPKELKFLEGFVAEKRYQPIAEQMLQDDYLPPLPRKALISKKNTDKKRVIYFYPPDEHQMFKLLNHLMMRRYDSRLSEACHSFRVGRSVKTVMNQIRNFGNLENKYSLKLDLTSYGNSIPVEQLLSCMGKIIDDDPELMSFMSRVLRRSQATYGGEVITEPMGAMTGTPIVGFCENLYLKDVDNNFLARGIPYFRYGDDIMMLLNSEEEQKAYLEEITEILVGVKGLKLNMSKVCMTKPGETWEYLGVSFNNGQYDLARNTVEKTKTRIRRYARRLYRVLRCRKNLSYEEVAGIFLRRFNAMFYNIFGDNEFAWNRWYFSVLTTSKSLKEIDEYMQRYLRYLKTGRHGKANYRITYAQMKEMGYRSLVHEYYEYLKNPPPESRRRKV